MQSMFLLALSPIIVTVLQKHRRKRISRYLLDAREKNSGTALNGEIDS